MKGPAYFEIQADSPARTIQFYEQVFGWKFEKAPGLPVEYWRIETGGARGGLLKRPGPVPPPLSGTNAFVCSLEAEVTAVGELLAHPDHTVFVCPHHDIGDEGDQPEPLAIQKGLWRNVALGKPAS